METVIAFVVVVIALLILFSVGGTSAPAPTPQPAPVPLLPALPIMVELGTLAMRTEITMSAVENTLRSRQLQHEAEGARQVRAAVNTLLEGLKHEQP